MPGATSPLPLVCLADGRQFSGVIGVVDSRMVYEAAPGKAAEREMSIHSTYGAVGGGIGFKLYLPTITR